MEETRKVYPMGDMVMYGRQPSPLAGKTVVITGKLWRFTRKEAHQQLLSRGAIVKRTVTKKTDYLVRGEKPGAKLDKAIAELGAEGIDAKACRCDISDRASLEALANFAQRVWAPWPRCCTLPA